MTNANVLSFLLEVLAGFIFCGIAKCMFLMVTTSMYAMERRPLELIAG